VSVTIPPEPWVVVAPSEVREGAVGCILGYEKGKPTSRFDMIKLAREHQSAWSVMSAAKSARMIAMYTNRDMHVVCSPVACITPNYTCDASRFPRTCDRCGRGVYIGANVVEHDGPCGGTP